MIQAVLHPLYQGFALVIGMVVGSFLGVCVSRLPEGRSLWTPSACPRCGTRIGWRDNVPVLSWVALGARCRHCSASIPASYPLIEVLGGLLGWLVYRRILPTPAELDPAHGAAWVLYFGFVAALVVSAATDVRHHVIPEETSTYAIPVGVVGSAALGWLGYDGWPYVGWQQSVLGVVLAGGFFWLLAVAHVYIRGEVGLGAGDVKLVAMIGAFVGAIPGSWLVMLIGSFLGATVALVHMVGTGRRSYLPFGPSLALAGVVYLLYGDLILPGVGPGR